MFDKLELLRNLCRIQGSLTFCWDNYIKAGIDYVFSVRKKKSKHNPLVNVAYFLVTEGFSDNKCSSRCNTIVY